MLQVSIWAVAAAGEREKGHVSKCADPFQKTVEAQDELN